jgi:hypothetical protein
MTQNSASSRKEVDLRRYLHELEANAEHLPSIAELEPGAFLHFVNDAWGGEEGRDGRRGYLSEERIAQAIKKRIDRAFSRNQYQSMFGDGRRAGRDGDRSRQPVPRDVAKAFLEVAFDHWSMDQTGNAKPYDAAGINLRKAVDNACNAMFAQEEPVYCKPSPGQGPFGLYEQCGETHTSIIVATQRQPVVMKNPAKQINEWLRLMRSLLRPEIQEALEKKPIHVWAILEPWVGPKPESLEAMHGISNLRYVFWAVNNIMNANTANPTDKLLWEIQKKRSVVAIKRDPRNRAQPRLATVPKSSPIIQTDIFPDEIPALWSKMGVTNNADDLNSLVTLRANQGSGVVEGYYVFDYYEPRPPYFCAKYMPSPGPTTNESFQRLYSATRQFLEPSSGTQDRDLASDDGWHFMGIDEFIDIRLPSEERARGLGIPKAGSDTSRIEQNVRAMETD